MKSELSSQSLSSNLSSETTSNALYKLEGEDTQRWIASEKIKRKSDNKEQGHPKTSFVSVFRYYRGIAHKPKANCNSRYSYIHSLHANRHVKHKHPISYSHFLSEDNISNQLYDAYFLEFEENNATFPTSGSQFSLLKLKQEINGNFRVMHPEISPEMTFTKIKSVKLRLLNVTKVLDLELSSLSHAFVYFEKLLQKNIITKQNRKLVAACCLYLAVKINEPKGVSFKDLSKAIYEEFDVGSTELKEHEFAVFADLEFNLYVSVSEFMPHFNRLLTTMDYYSVKDYIGNESFYEFKL